MIEQTLVHQGVFVDRCRLKEHLAVLDDKNAIPDLLRDADLSLLNFLAGGVGMARRVLAIEEASRPLLGMLPLQDPESVEDAHTIRNSSIRALTQMSQVLSLVRQWLMTSPYDIQEGERAIREVFHAFNNVLVGINCYSELLLMELQIGDPCYEALQVIHNQGEITSKLVLERARLQRHLNELGDCDPEEIKALDQEILHLLLETLGIDALQKDEAGHIQISQDHVERRCQELPLAECHVLREAVRRIDTLQTQED